jgi:hypothetical protein
MLFPNANAVVGIPVDAPRHKVERGDDGERPLENVGQVTEQERLAVAHAN